MDKLLKDISNYKQSIANATTFIKNKNIKLYKFNKIKINEKDLPYNLYMGSNYLIKNNNIINMYAYCSYKHSLSEKINAHCNTWICTIDIINIQEGDPENLTFLIDESEYTFHPSILEYFVLDFVQAGFSLYV
jgi:hypothetical protein